MKKYIFTLYQLIDDKNKQYNPGKQIIKKVVFRNVWYYSSWHVVEVDSALVALPDFKSGVAG